MCCVVSLRLCDCLVCVCHVVLIMRCVARLHAVCVPPSHAIPCGCVSVCVFCVVNLLVLCLYERCVGWVGGRYNKYPF